MLMSLKAEEGSLAEDCRQALEAGRKTYLPLEPPEATSSADTLISAL